MQKQDLDGVVQVHQTAFPGFFMTLMGPEFLRFYYQFVLDHPGSVALVSEENGQVTGFVVGFFEPDKFYDAFAAQKPKLAVLMLKSVLRKPTLLPRVITNVLRVSARTEPIGDVELSSIGVGKAGKGTGKSLLQAFLETAYARGGQTIYLTTDAVNNDGVNAFYLKNQFSLVRDFMSGQRKMNLYVHQKGTP